MAKNEKNKLGVLLENINSYFCTCLISNINHRLLQAAAPIPIVFFSNVMFLHTKKHHMDIICTTDTQQDDFVINDPNKKKSNKLSLADGQHTPES